MRVDFGYRDTVLRPRAGQVLAVLVIAVCGVGVGGFLLRGDLETLARGLFPLLLIATGAWVLFWQPAVRITPATLELVNPLRTVRVTWPAIEDIETRWSLTVTVAGRRYAAWAAPRESGSSASGPRGAVTVAGRPGPAARPLPPGALAGLLARRQWEEYRDRGLLGSVEGDGVDIRWHATTTAVLAVLVLGALASIAVP